MGHYVLKLDVSLAYVDDLGKVDSKTGSLAAPVQKQLIPVGESYAAYARRQAGGLSFEQDDANEAARLAAEHANGTVETQDKDFVEEEPESVSLLKRDPKDWKAQDHYEVLGLSKLRYKATPGQVNFAHRRKVLKHHPDKKAKLGGDSNDDAFFKCIAKAHEYLSDPAKRRLYDSVDEGVSEDFPENTTENSFIQSWGPVFERESRFSKNGSLPDFGTLDSSKPDVERFYDYWYNFDSWRSFEYKDKEVNEGADSRDEKRHAERKNKAQRAALKTEDNSRLRDLVDQALRQDPRIRKFKQAEKEARDQKKKKTQQASPIQQKAEAEAKRKAEEEKLKADQAAKEQEDKAARDAAKKQREAAKKNLKRDKKAVIASVTKANYFAAPSSAPDPIVIEGVLGELDRILDALEPEEVSLLRADAEAASTDEALRTTIVKSSGVAQERGIVVAHLV